MLQAITMSIRGMLANFYVFHFKGPAQETALPDNTQSPRIPLCAMADMNLIAAMRLLLKYENRLSSFWSLNRHLQAEPQNPIVANFVSMLQNWAANPTCPYAADSPAARRLLRSRSSSDRENSVSSAETLSSRDLDVSTSTQLDALIVALCLGKTSLAPQLQLAFTQYFTEPFQAACSDFTRLWNSWQNADQTLLTSEYRCEGHGVMRALQDSAALSSNLCTPTPPACSTKRGDTTEPAYNDSKTPLFERTIENDFDINGAAVNGDGPSLGKCPC